MITTLAFAVVLSQPSPLLTVTLGGVAQGVRPLAYAAAPSGVKFVATLENNTARIIDSKTHMTIKQMTGLVAPAYAVAWSPNGKLIATGDESARVILWDAGTAKPIRTFRDHTKGIEALAFNAASTMLISTGKDDAINVYTLANYKKQKTILGKGINLYGGLFMGKGSNILVGTLGKGAAIYSIGGQMLAALGGHNGEGVMEAAVNPAGTLIASAGKDGVVTIWDAKTKKKLNSLHGHGDWVIHVGFSPNGRFLATSSSDGTVRIWDPKTFRQVVKLEYQTRVVGSPLCFTSDGKTLVTVSVDDFLQYNTLNPPQAGKPEATPRSKRRRR